MVHPKVEDFFLEHLSSMEILFEGKDAKELGEGMYGIKTDKDVIIAEMEHLPVMSFDLGKESIRYKYGEKMSILEDPVVLTIILSKER